MAKFEDMWQCQTANCGYIYDPDRGDKKGKIRRSVLKTCPKIGNALYAGVGKEFFKPLAVA